MQHRSTSVPLPKLQPSVVVDISSNADSSGSQDMMHPGLPVDHSDDATDSTECDTPEVKVAPSRRFNPSIVMNSNITEVDCGKSWRRMFGTRWSLCHTPLWCVSDCCGWTCCIVTWLLLAYAQFVIFAVVLSPDSHLSSETKVINGIIWEFFVLLAVVSHVKAMMSNPGAIPFGNCTGENLRRLGYTSEHVILKCPKCLCIKPEKTHHCSICRRCIAKMDHHCPWVNNCVGERNQKYFVLFTLYVSVISWYALVLAVIFLLGCVSTSHGSGIEQCAGTWSSATIMLLSIFLIFESVLFGLFTLVMCSTQVHGICTDTSTVDRVKQGDNNEVTRSTEGFGLVFGAFTDPRSWSPFHPSPMPHDPMYDFHELSGLKVM